MPQGFVRFVARRFISAAALVLLVSSAAMVLSRLAPGNRLSAFDIDPAVAAAECARTRCDDPLLQQYAAWLTRIIRFDLGESTAYGRPVGQLIRERARNSFVLGLCALFVATALGIPAGVMSGSRRRGPLVRLTQAGSILLLSCPPLICALALILIAARTRWFPIGGMALADATFAEQIRYLVLPVLALGLPMAATLERLQAQAMGEALAEPCILAASGRGIDSRRLVWRHALKLSLTPVLAIYGIVIGSLISGSFIVEYVMAWPGLGSLMFEALVARDSYLVAGCAAAGSLALSLGILMSDVALALVNPRTVEGA